MTLRSCIINRKKTWCRIWWQKRVYRKYKLVSSNFKVKFCNQVQNNLEEDKKIHFHHILVSNHWMIVYVLMYGEGLDDPNSDDRQPKHP